MPHRVNNSDGRHSFNPQNSDTIADKIIDRIKANHKFRDEQDLRLVMLFDPYDYVK